MTKYLTPSGGNIYCAISFLGRPHSMISENRLVKFPVFRDVVGSEKCNQNGP